MDNEPVAIQAAIIAERWPTVWKTLAAAPPPRSLELCGDRPQPTLIIDGIHLSSCYDAEAEARLQASLIPPNSPSVWLYGAGTGDLATELLRRQALRILNVVILNSTVFQQSLQVFDHRPWLSDPRVVLQIPDQDSDLHPPFCAVPACLRLADDGAARLRDQVVLELNTPFGNQRFFSNPAFREQVKANRALVEQDADVAELFDSRRGCTAMIAAAGPTLEEHYRRLRSRTADHCLIAVDAALKPLLENGVTPDIVISIDGRRDTMLAFLDVAPASVSGIPLVYFPVVHPDALRSWSAPRYAAYSSAPLYQELARVIPRGELFANGTVLHPAVDLAVRMGARSVQLYGADLSYPGGISHVRGAVVAARVVSSDGRAWVADCNGNRIPTDLNLRGFLRDLERYIARHPEVRFINAGTRGACIKGSFPLTEA